MQNMLENFLTKTEIQKDFVDDVLHDELSSKLTRTIAAINEFEARLLDLEIAVIELQLQVSALKNDKQPALQKEDADTRRSGAIGLRHKFIRGLNL